MLRCTHCGSSFDPIAVASIADCPRCQGREGLRSPLSFDPSPRSRTGYDINPGSADGFHAEATEPVPGASDESQHGGRDSAGA
jgi:hypothetical protein